MKALKKSRRKSPAQKAQAMAERIRENEMRKSLVPADRRWAARERRLVLVRESLSRLRRERIEMVRRGEMVIPRELDHRITILEHEERFLEESLPRSLGDIITDEQADEHRLMEHLLECHTAADFLNDCVFRLREIFRRLGVEECNLFRLTDELEKRSAEFAGLICRPEFADLSEYMTTDADLIRDLHTILSRYMGERLKVRGKRVSLLRNEA